MQLFSVVSGLRLLSVAGIKPSYSGSFALYSLLLLLIIVFIAFCLFIALIVMGLMGRFSTPPPAESGADASGPDDIEAEAPDGGQTEGEAQPPKKALFRLPGWKTGLPALLCGIGLCVVALVFFNLFENLYGRMVAFNGGTIVQFICLAAQLVMVVLLVVYQRRR